MAVVSIPCYFDAQMPRDYFTYNSFWPKGRSPVNLVPYYVRLKPVNVLISLLKPPKESRLYLKGQDCREVSISWCTDLACCLCEMTELRRLSRANS